MHSLGIVHRDIHTTRIHYSNGLCKFNLIGLPYNFRKLLKFPSQAGHVNFSAPEILLENESDDFGEDNYTMKAETWSLGCCLYQMATKLDPFEGSNLNETKKNI